MKWTLLAIIIGLTAGCCNTGIVAYQQVRVVPAKKVVPVIPMTKVRVVPVVTRVVTPVIEPILVDYVEPVDVTTTTIDFY